MTIPFNPRMKPRLGTPINKAMAHKLGLIGCWLFNDNPPLLGNTFDVSGHGNHGTLVGDTKVGPGDFGPALSFGGTGYIEADKILVTSYPFTMSAWIKTTSNPGLTQIILMLVDKDVANIYYDIHIRDTNVGAMRARNTTTHVTTGAKALNDGLLHHVVGVFASDTDRRLYIDGIRDTTNEDNGSSTYSSAIDRWDIGRAGDSSPDSYLNGQIDNVMIFNRALNANEIQQLYREPFCMFQRELIELWAASGGAPPAGHPYYYREFANRRIA